MAWRQSTNGGPQRLFAKGLFKPFPLTMTWWTYVESLGDPSFGTMWSIGPTTFGGVNYYLPFHDRNSVPQVWALGAEGIDALGSSVQTGRWHRQGFRATSRGAVGYDLSFWPDLTTTEVITRSESGFTITFSAGHEFYFGRVPWTAGEFLQGRLAAAKIWQAALPLEAIKHEVQSAWPVLEEYKPALWAVYPFRTALDMRDYSGNGRHLTPTGTLSSIEEPTGLVQADVLNRRRFYYRSGVAAAAAAVEGRVLMAPYIPA